MKLRFLITYDNNGIDSNPSLQYWDKEDQRWIEVNTFRCKEKDEEEYNTNEHYC